jgi:hypothetical protein
VIPGRPLSEQAVLEVLTTSTGLKLEPAVPLAFIGTSASWAAVQGAGGLGWVVVVVVVDDVLVVDVVGASVVDVDVEVGGGLDVVVVGVAA